MQWDYETIKELARETPGVNVGDLCALAPNNDPFYTGRPAERAAAEWFAGLWQRFGYSSGIHLRRVHYQVVSQDPVMSRPDGTPYENTEACWAYLCSAGKWARYLGLISPLAFEDHRNPKAKVYTRWSNPGDPNYQDPEPDYELDDPEDWNLYGLPGLPELPNLPHELPDLPGFYVYGYDVQQEYHVEVWVEKTTMDDVLEPLCSEYRANLITGAGEMSITAVLDFLKRARESERAARILYVSDYDPAGLGMPISVARKIEFYQRAEGFGDLDVRLQPIVLTADQVKRYRLPRVPVKDSDLRKANWQAHHGVGQVELDALEALHPGELAGIVEGALLNYFDPGLTDRANGKRDGLKEALAQAGGNTLECHHDDLRELRADYETLQGDFAKVQERFDELAATFQPEIDALKDDLAGIIERGRELYQGVRDDLDEVDVDTDDYPLPEPDLPPESNGTLYVSGRDYLDQVEMYQAYRENDKMEV